jgi:hypothetical protein
MTWRAMSARPSLGTRNKKKATLTELRVYSGEGLEGFFA